MTILRIPHDLLDEDPEQCLYKGQKFTGIALEFDGAGNFDGETHFKDGIQYGVQFTPYLDGTLEGVSFSIHYINYGPELEYFPNGSLKTEQWYYMGIKIPKQSKKPEKPLIPDSSSLWNNLKDFPVELIDFSLEVSEVNKVLEQFGKKPIYYL